MNEKLKAERALLSPPGDDIAETIKYNKMSQAELAKRLGKKPSKVHDIITGKEPITVNTALQLEKVLGMSAQYWLNRESNYREKLTRLQQKEFLETCKGWLSEQPVKQLKQCGYLKAKDIGPAMVEETLQFYGVTTPEQWESIYVKEYAMASYRKSPAHKDALGSMAAFLRIGEIEMRKLNVAGFTKTNFKNLLTTIKALAVKHPANFKKKLQQLCADAGVAIVYTTCLPKAPVSGATRWIGNNPLIQLTDRHKTSDHFWFTFFHEAGHVLLHGKKKIFLEDFEGYKEDGKKEMEADTFAAKSLLPETFVDELPKDFTEDDVVKMAKKYKTAPGIVVGRLQHLKLAHYSFGKGLKKKVKLF
ncbi:MAG: ImmA/IrrE family metallo-endopeptidase [Chitinophagaceae bacterium]